jgi:GNAT superfamily N-acetyltransferase
MPSLSAVCFPDRDIVDTLATIIDVDHPTKLRDLWAEFSKDVEKGTRAIVLQFVTTQDEGERLAGVATLLMPMSETGPHRCWVEKLLVSPRFRRQGIAKALMNRLEIIARDNGRWLMVGDVERRGCFHPKFESC